MRTPVIKAIGKVDKITIDDDNINFLFEDKPMLTLFVKNDNSISITKSVIPINVFGSIIESKLFYISILSPIKLKDNLSLFDGKEFINGYIYF